MMDGVRRWGGLPRRVLRELNLLEPEGSVDAIHDVADSESAQALSGEASRPGRLAPLASLAPPAHRAEPDHSGDLAASPEDLLAQAELHALLRKAIGHLPKKEREAVKGYYFSGRSLKQIAAIAGVTESGASRMLTRALERVDAELRRRRVVSLAGRPPKA